MRRKLDDQRRSASQDRAQRRPDSGTHHRGREQDAHQRLRDEGAPPRKPQDRTRRENPKLRASAKALRGNFSNRDGDPRKPAQTLAFRAHRRPPRGAETGLCRRAPLRAERRISNRNSVLAVQGLGGVFRGEFGDGAPGEIRTPDPQIRSLVLYPAELRAREGREPRQAAARWQAPRRKPPMPIRRRPPWRSHSGKVRCRVDGPARLLRPS